jgi:hypothetical protein
VGEQDMHACLLRDLHNSSCHKCPSHERSLLTKHAAFAVACWKGPSLFGYPKSIRVWIYKLETES